VAYDKGVEEILMQVLSILLEALDRPDLFWDTQIESITLIRYFEVFVCRKLSDVLADRRRCLIRLTLLEIEKAEDK
jgi:hypothetical protein